MTSWGDTDDEVERYSDDRHDGPRAAPREQDERPLLNEWAFYLRPQSGSFEDKTPTAVINYISEYWDEIVHLNDSLQHLSQGRLFAFKDGALPLWEDKANLGGGRLILIFKPHHGLTVWRELVVALLGGQMTEHNDITGAALTIKSGMGALVQVWVNWKVKAKRIENLKQELLSLIPSVSLKFYWSSHSMAMSQSRPTSRHRSPMASGARTPVTDSRLSTPLAGTSRRSSIDRIRTGPTTDSASSSQRKTPPIAPVQPKTKSKQKEPDARAGGEWVTVGPKHKKDDARKPRGSPSNRGRSRPESGSRGGGGSAESGRSRGGSSGKSRPQDGPSVARSSSNHSGNVLSKSSWGADPHAVPKPSSTQSFVGQAVRALQDQVSTLQNMSMTSGVSEKDIENATKIVAIGAKALSDISRVNSNTISKESAKQQAEARKKEQRERAEFLKTIDRGFTIETVEEYKKPSKSEMRKKKAVARKAEESGANAAAAAVDGDTSKKKKRRRRRGKKRDNYRRGCYGRYFGYQCVRRCVQTRSSD